MLKSIQKIVSLVLVLIIIITLLLLSCVPGYAQSEIAFQSSQVTATNEEWLWPIQGVYSMSRGYTSYHTGVDVWKAGIYNTPIRAVKSGIVVASGNTCTHDYDGAPSCECGYTMGNYVKIKHTDGTYSRYMHMIHNTPVALNTVVKQGDIIGRVGTSGDSTGPHLHFELFNTSDQEFDNNPINYDGRHTVSNASTYQTQNVRYIYDINQNHYLDINGQCYNDGQYERKSNIEDWGTCDVYINGTRDANDVTDYYTQWPTGTRYQIKDIRATGLNSVCDSMEDLGGIIGSSDVDVRIEFRRIHLRSDTGSLYLSPGQMGEWVYLYTSTGDPVDQIICTCYSDIIEIRTDTVFENTSSCSIYVKGLTPGDTTIYASIVRGDEAETIKIPVHVSGYNYDRYIEVSDWDVELIGDVSGYGFPKTITVTCPGSYPSSYYLNYDLGDYDLFNVSYDSWNGNSIDMRLLAKYPVVVGSTWMRIGLYDSSNDSLVDSVTINVTVTDPYNVWVNGIHELHRIENGYWSNKVLTNNGRNVEQGSDTGTTTFTKHLWVFERQDDKTYIVRNLYDNTYLVPGSNYNDAGCNVYTTETYPTSRSQRWAVKAHPDGGYYLCLATINDMVLDIDNASMDVGANAQLWWENGTSAQSFDFDYWGSEIYVPRESFTPSTPYLWSYYNLASKYGYISWTDSPVITDIGAFDSRAYEFELWDLTTDTLIDYTITTSTEYYFWNAEANHNYRVWVRAVNTEFDYYRVPYTSSSWTCTDFSGPVNPFVDVKPGKYYYDAVLWAISQNPPVTNGTDDTHFSPNKTCTRGQVVTFLWNAMGQPEPASTSNPFVDVKKGKFYYKPVLWAVENGITNGMDATHFNPNGECTRGQVVTFLWKAMGSPEPTSTNNPFTDVKKGKYYYKPVLWAVENGVTSGTTATTFSPDKTCTRGQVVTFLYNTLAK